MIWRGAFGIVGVELERAESLRKVGEIFDVLVIGGGATGLGVALDSASRGYKTLLVEARDFAQGTSSRSTKLVHGGVRYLQQGNIGLVREALHERGRLLRNAPHLVHELRFLIPAYRWWRIGFYGAGLKLYDVLAGSLKLSPVRIVGADTAARLVSTLKRERLKGRIIYSDAQFNDARLAISLERTADAHGATLLNYAPVKALCKTGDKVSGAIITDEESGREYEVRARSVVNATGVYTDAIRRMDDPGAEEIIAVSQGIHVLLDRSFLPDDTAIMVPRTEDGRVVFIIPWQGRTLVGTTDTPLPAASEEPAALESEIEFVLDHAGMYLSRQPVRENVLSVYAGLRPLVKGGGESTAALSRDHMLLVSPSGLVTITGGKWTTYRRMAEDTVDRVATIASLPSRPCATKGLPLHGWDGTNPQWLELGATRQEIEDLESAYPGQLHARLPYSMAMAAYVIRHEMPLKLEDVLSRRLRALLLDARAAQEAAPRVAKLMADLQGRDEEWVASEVAAFKGLAKSYDLS